MQKLSFVIGLGAGLGMMFLAAVPAAAQAPAVEEGGFGETLEVRGVDLEVVVTDAQGNRVSGLTSDDFQVRLDGQRVPLDFFIEVRGGRVASLSQDEAIPGAAPRTLAGPGEEVGTSYLVFVDLLFSGPKLRGEALRALAKEVPRLGPKDRMAIVQYDGQAVRALTDWTRSEDTLVAALDGAARIKGTISGGALTGSRFSAQSVFEPATGTSEFEDRVNSSSDPRVEARIGVIHDNSGDDGYDAAKRELQGIERVVAAATAALRGFSDPPGRKVALVLSAGWVVDQVSEGGSYQTASARSTLRDGYSLLTPLTDAANLLGYTLYPLHLAERADSLPGAEDSGRQVNFNGSPRQADRSRRHQLGQNALVLTARETGGQLLLPGDNRHLSEVAADVSSYYWVGFTHSGSGDDRRRSLEVRVTRPGLQVRSRSSFLPLSRAAQASMEVEKALLTGKAGEMDPLGVTAGAARRAGVRLVDLPLSLRIPLDGIVMLPDGAGRYVARLELRVAALAEDGDRSEISVVPFEIGGDRPPEPGSHATYETVIRLRHRRQDLQVTVHDTLGGRALTGRITAEP